MKRRDGATAGEVIDSGISIIYQELALVAQMSVAENIFLGREPQRGFGVLDLQSLHERAAKLTERLGISLDTRTPVSELTVAQRQLVEIAKALSQNADLIVMDEPSAILAGSELDQLFRIISSLVEAGRHHHLHLAPARRGLSHRRRGDRAERWRACRYPSH